MTRKIVLGLLASLLALVIVPTAFAQGGSAKVRVIHASPDAPAVDVYVNGNRALSNVAFFTASDYLDLPAGTYQIQVTPAGAPVAQAVIDAEATIAAGRAYTIAATGAVAAIQPTIIEDDLSAPASGQAKVRVYHFSPDAPAVDVKLAAGDTLISSLAFPDTSDYLEVPAGSYDLQVVPAGASTVVIDLAGTRLEAGNIYSVFATNVVASIAPEVAVTTPVASGAGSAAGSTSGQPATLPTTAEGEGAPLGLIAGAALLLLATSVLLLRRPVA
jgi:Domain of unknown function (DUF4397)